MTCLFRLSNKQGTRRLLSMGAVLVVLWALVRWWWLVHEGSVNLLYMDQWDLYRAFFDDYAILETFLLQHGPHRQGMAFVLVGWINQLSGWNTRINGFVIGAFVCAAALLAWWVKVRLSGRINRQDCLLAVLFLTPVQYGLFANTPNLSHGAFPLFMVMLCCLCWTIQREVVRWASVLACNFILIFSGFGLFSGPILVGIMGMNLFSRWRSASGRWRVGMLAALCVALASLGVFFIGYSFEPAAPDFHFPVEQWWFRYPAFVLLMFTNLLGLDIADPSIGLVLLGVVLVLVLFAITWHAAWRMSGYNQREMRGLLISRDRARVILYLVAYTLAFCCNTAMGRATLGFSAAVQSRYVSYLIPALFAVYLYTDALDVGARARAGTAFLLVLLLVSLRLAPSHRATMEQLVAGKKAWRSAYLETRSILAASDRTGFVVYPWPELTSMEEKLDYMEKRGLNLFARDP